MKKLTLMTLAAMSLGLASCVKDVADYDPQTVKDGVTNAYNAAFVNTFGTPAPNQTWGFSTSTGSQAMRGTNDDGTWSENHSDDWANEKFDFEIPAGATTMTQPGFIDGIYVIPASCEGVVSLNWQGFSEGDKIINLGNVTELKEVNYNGTVTFYNVGTLTYSVSSGGRHTVINTGTLNVNNYANIGNLYNKGTLYLLKTYNPYYNDPNASVDIQDGVSIYSTGVIYMPDGGGQVNGTLDVHNMIYVTGDIEIANKHEQYVCGLVATGRLYLNKGKFKTSYAKAKVIEFNGDALWLLPEAYIEAEEIRMPNSATYVHGYENSFALVKADDFNFDNDNGFAESFSDNVYFKVGGTIYFELHSSKDKQLSFANAAEFLNSKYGIGLEDRINYEGGKTVTGEPGCGDNYSFNVPSDDPDPKDPDWTFLCRVFAEDLSATEATDFDFNDVVFDVYYDKNGTTNAAQIHLQAAGGTLPLYVGGIEVHGQFGEEGYGSNQMINTGAKANVNNVTAEPYLIQNVFTGNDQLDDVNKKINVVVTKFGEDVPLTAYEGKPAAKFAVTEKIVWPNEREGIEKKYPNFKSWVGDANVKWY